jgi:hypothetical protein
MTLPWTVAQLPVLKTVSLRLLATVTVVLALVVLAALRPEWLLGLCLATLAAAVAAAASKGVFARHLPLAIVGALGCCAIALFVGARMVAPYLTPRAVEYRLTIESLTPLIEHDSSRLPPRPDPSFMPLDVVVRVPDTDNLLATGVTAGYTFSPPGYQVLLKDGRVLEVPPDQVRPLTDTNISWLDLSGELIDGAALTFSPFVASAGASLRQIALAPDTLAWDALLVFAVISAFGQRRTSTQAVLATIVFPILIIGLLVVTATNLGTTVRHRGNLVPWLALAAEPLIVALWVRRTRPRAP